MGNEKEGKVKCFSVREKTFYSLFSVFHKQAMVDILDPKGSKAYDALIEAISDTYPHVYLALTGQDDLDDDSDDGK